MRDPKLDLRLGLGAVAASAFLFLVAIPGWVATPSNVSNMVLSPRFWPNVLAALTGLVGLGLIAIGLRAPGPAPQVESDVNNRTAAFTRLAISALIMIAAMLTMPRIGMVWTAMPVFAVMAFLMRTDHPKTAILSAAIVPLLLYFFFAHVAGVAIPQGEFVRLP